MGIWIEFRCENRDKISADGGCWSHTNDGPMGMASDNILSVKNTIKELSDHALNSEWKKVKGKWYCPFCSPLIKMMESKDE